MNQPKERAPLRVGWRYPSVGAGLGCEEEAVSRDEQSRGERGLKSCGRPLRSQGSGLDEWEIQGTAMTRSLVVLDCPVSMLYLMLRTACKVNYGVVHLK